MASGAFPGSYPLGFMPRRSVVDPDTGLPVIASAPTGAVRQRSTILPIGRDDGGALVPAVPQGVFDAIDAARGAGRAQLRADERAVKAAQRTLKSVFNTDKLILRDAIDDYRDAGGKEKNLKLPKLPCV